MGEVAMEFIRRPEKPEDKASEEEKTEFKEKEREFQEALEDAAEIEVRGFEKREDHPEEMDNDEIRILLDRYLGTNPALVRFLEEHCALEFNKDTEEPVTVRAETKIVIEVNPDALFDYGQTTFKAADGKETRLRYFNPAKIIFIIGRVIGTLLSEPGNWQEAAKSRELHQKGLTSWEDFIGFCLSQPEEAKKVCPEGYQHFETILKHPEIAADIKRKLPAEGKQKVGLPAQIAQFYKPPEGETALTAREGLLVRFWNRVNFLGLRLVWRQTDWAERMIAEFEDKEKSRILVRDESITDRDRRLKELIEVGDEFGLRCLLLADAQTSDSLWWRYHAFLEATDKTYRATNGERISKKSYNFISRCLRISHRERRRGTKPNEYKPEQGNYVRRSREEWEKEVLTELLQNSSREVMNTAQETFEHMIRKGKHYELDEKLGEGEFGFLVSTGDLRELLGDGFAQRMSKRANARGTMSKHDPDQLAVLARTIPLISEMRVRGRVPEHLRASALEAIEYYEKEFRKTYGDMIEFYETRQREKPDSESMAEAQEIIEKQLYLLDLPIEKAAQNLKITSQARSEAESRIHLIIERTILPDSLKTALKADLEVALKIMERIKTVKEASGEEEADKVAQKYGFKKASDLKTALRELIKKAKVRATLREIEELDEYTQEIAPYSTKIGSLLSGKESKEKKKTLQEQAAQTKKALDYLSRLRAQEKPLDPATSEFTELIKDITLPEGLPEKLKGRPLRPEWQPDELEKWHDHLTRAMIAIEYENLRIKDESAKLLRRRAPGIDLEIEEEEE